MSRSPSIQVGLFLPCVESVCTSVCDVDKLSQLFKATATSPHVATRRCYSDTLWARRRPQPRPLTASNTVTVKSFGFPTVHFTLKKRVSPEMGSMRTFLKPSFPFKNLLGDKSMTVLHLVAAWAASGRAAEANLFPLLMKNCSDGRLNPFSLVNGLPNSAIPRVTA